MRMIALMPVWSEPVFVTRLAVFRFEQQRRAAIPMPQLGSVDLVPARHLARFEEKQDSRRMSPPMRAGLVAKGLAEPAALRMGLQSEMRDHLVRGQRVAQS
jgi:hypothetical protein